MNFAKLLTPEEAYELEANTNEKPAPLAVYYHRARSQKSCEVCGQPAWRFAGHGLCFTCTTGEADASNDYELAPLA